MKPFKALLLTSLVLGACEKSNDITQLHEEAVAIAKWSGPQVDELMKRRDAIFQRGRNVPGNLPDVPEIVKLIGDAGDKINEMKGITGGIEKQADALQKDGKIEELGKLIDDSHEKLDEDWTIANDDLTKVEGWLWSYEQGHMAGAPVAPPQPTPSTTGEVPPAEAQGSGAGSGAAAPKAEDKKADEKKAAPKAEKAGSAAPKAGAGSAAK